ncbi:MaoC/PaaZ C-terminal domain-containing protein [uncultured Marinobacter sp.]|uniref:MaoC family dehydratase n=1 Tax=uncultured Marinobacter sp. TaxID=187379 RepID=UPI0030DA6074
MKTIELSGRPSIVSQYLRAAVARKSGPVPNQQETLADIRLADVRADREKLRAYRSVCGFAGSSSLPVTYPFVLALPLHLELMLSDAFPFSPVGLVHIRNRIHQHRIISNEATLALHCTLSGPRTAGKGLEFDIHTQVQAGEETVWECTSTMLKRTGDGGTSAGGKKPAPGADDDDTAAPDHSEPWDLPANLGRRYGKASGDVNPIHLHALSAKLFGFPRAIAHGMWTKARCLAALEPMLPAGPCTVDVAFKLPIFLPGQVQFSYRRSGAEAAEGPQRIEFDVKDDKGEKPHLTGWVETG